MKLRNANHWFQVMLQMALMQKVNDIMLFQMQMLLILPTDYSQKNSAVWRSYFEGEVRSVGSY